MEIGVFLIFSLKNTYIPDATIIILMDSKQYTKIKDEFTEVTGYEYLLIPIDSKQVFHSKIFMFISDKKTQTILGSHNLTFSGIVQNLELCCNSDDDALFITKSVRNNICPKGELNPNFELIIM